MCIYSKFASYTVHISFPIAASDITTVYSSYSTTASISIGTPRGSTLVPIDVL